METLQLHNIKTWLAPFSFLKNHTYVLGYMAAYYDDAFTANGFCIFSQCKKEGNYLRSLSWFDIYSILGFFALMFVLRLMFDNHLSVFIAEHFDMKTDYHPRLPETLWKCVCSLFFLINCLELLFLQYPYFHRIETVWFAEPQKLKQKEDTPLIDLSWIDVDRGDWQIGMEVPIDMQLLFHCRLAFYGHALYCLYFVDRDRDFDYSHTVTQTRFKLLHHLGIIALLYITLVVPYVRVGVCVIYINSICSFQLELLKFFMYMKDGSESRLTRWMVNILTVTLIISWIYYKLHLFVTRVLYMTFPLLLNLQKGWIVNRVFPFAILLNTALVLMLINNWFWFIFMIRKYKYLRRKPKTNEIDYGKELLTRFSSFNGWYTFDDEMDDLFDDELFD